MKLASIYSDLTFLAIAALAIPLTSQPARAAGGTAVSHNGVTIRVLDGRFSGNSASLGYTLTETLSLDRLPTQVSGFAVLESEMAVDPHGRASGEKAVLRGGVFSGSAESCTSWNRYCDEPGFTDACGESVTIQSAGQAQAAMLTAIGASRLVRRDAPYFAFFSNTSSRPNM